MCDIGIMVVEVFELLEGAGGGLERGVGIGCKIFEGGKGWVHVR